MKTKPKMGRPKIKGKPGRPPKYKKEATVESPKVDSPKIDLPSKIEPVTESKKSEMSEFDRLKGPKLNPPKKIKKPKRLPKYPG